VKCCRFLPITERRLTAQIRDSGNSLLILSANQTHEGIHRKEGNPV